MPIPDIKHLACERCSTGQYDEVLPIFDSDGCKYHYHLEAPSGTEDGCFHPQMPSDVCAETQCPLVKEGECDGKD